MALPTASVAAPRGPSRPRGPALDVDGEVLVLARPGPRSKARVGIGGRPPAEVGFMLMALAGRSGPSPASACFQNDTSRAAARTALLVTCAHLRQAAGIGLATSRAEPARPVWNRFRQRRRCGILFPRVAAARWPLWSRQATGTHATRTPRGPASLPAPKRLACPVRVGAWASARAGPGLSVKVKPGRDVPLLSSPEEGRLAEGTPSAVALSASEPAVCACMRPSIEVSDAPGGGAP